MISGSVSLNWIVHGLLNIVMGGLNDRFGPRIVLTVSGVLLAIGFLLVSQTNAIWQLYLFYGGVVGAAMAGFYVPLVSTVAKWFVRRRSFMTGIVVSGASIGTLVGPPIANWLISIFDWRLAYIIMGSVASLIVVLTAQLLRRDPAQVGQLPDGEHKEQISGQESMIGGLSLRKAACTGQFWILLGIWFCCGFCSYAIVIHIVPHAIELGINSSTAASILATFGGVSILGRVIMGNTADRIGNRTVLIIAFVLMAITLFWLISAKELWMLLLFAAVFGFAYGSCDSPISPLVATLFGLRSHGLLIGILSIGFTIGTATGPYLAGYIFDVEGSYQVAFLIFTIVAIIGLILVTVLRPFRSTNSYQNPTFLRP